MYLETFLIPSNKDEWIINLHLQDDTKVEARLVRGYKQAVEQTKKWSESLGDCKYTIGSITHGNTRKQ